MDVVHKGDYCYAGLFSTGFQVYRLQGVAQAKIIAMPCCRGVSSLIKRLKILPCVPMLNMQYNGHSTQMVVAFMLRTVDPKTQLHRCINLRRSLHHQKHSHYTRSSR